MLPVPNVKKPPMFAAGKFWITDFAADCSIGGCAVSCSAGCSGAETIASLSCKGLRAGSSIANFLGADKPYEKLKKALRADLNENVWEELYSTTSRPFPKPKTGKIAIKVINHYGDEVMKIVEVR